MQNPFSKKALAIDEGPGEPSKNLARTMRKAKEPKSAAANTLKPRSIKVIIISCRPPPAPRASMPPHRARRAFLVSSPSSSPFSTLECRIDVESSAHFHSPPSFRLSRYTNATAQLARANDREQPRLARPAKVQFHHTMHVLRQAPARAHPKPHLLLVR